MRKIFLAFLIIIALSPFVFAEEATKPEENPEHFVEVKTKEEKPAEEKKAEEKAVEKSNYKLKATGWFANIKDTYRMAISFEGKVPKYSSSNENGKITLKFDSAVAYEAPKIGKEYKGVFEDVSAENNPHLTVKISYNADVSAKVWQNKTMLYIDVVKKVKDKKEEPKKEESKKEEVKKEDSQKTKNNDSLVIFSKDGKTEKLEINFSAPTPMAAFERFGYFWLVFDTTEKREIKNELLKKSAIFENVQKINAENALVFRLTLKAAAQASVAKTDNGWQVEFDREIKYQVANPINLEVVNSSVKIPVKNIGRKIIIEDDFTGDELQIITLLDVSTGVSALKEAIDLVFEKTVQGVLYRNYGNVAQFAIMPEGAVISKAAPINVAPLNKASSLPLFKFENWKQLSGAEFDTKKNSFSNKESLEYGKFLFGQKIYNEAVSSLARVNGFDAQFLTAAALLLSGKPDMAIDRLSKIEEMSARDSDEFMMWKLAAEYEMLQLQYEKQSGLQFPVGFAIPRNIVNYPPEIAAQLLIDLTERKINDGDIIFAQDIGKFFPKNAPKYAANYNSFLQGLIADKSNKRARAKEIWDKLVTEYDDRKTRAHAVYYLALQNYELGKVNAEETTKILDKVRIIWRGDRFEYELLKKLGDVYLAGGNNISALRTYREAVLNFPKHPDNEMLTERMRIAYANALTKDLSTPDKTFEAVALYYEFQELKPAGEDGDKITGELAEKLADYDLLKEAADLMEKSIEKISVPEDKALVATRVAILRYMNHNPQLALDMLNKSELKTIPAYIQNERDILAVNAMADLGQNDAAWKLVTKLPPERGKQVKAEILWKNKQWREMLVLYESMADKTLADIMKIAIAKAMIDDKKGLADLQKEYAGRMQKSEYADLFKFTTDSGEIDYHNLPASLNLDSAKKLVDIYKSRLKKGGVGALAPEKKSAELPKAAAVTKK